MAKSVKIELLQQNATAKENELVMQNGDSSRLELASVVMCITRIQALT